MNNNYNYNNKFNLKDTNLKLKDKYFIKVITLFN